MRIVAKNPRNPEDTAKQLAATAKNTLQGETIHMTLPPGIRTSDDAVVTGIIAACNRLGVEAQFAPEELEVPFFAKIVADLEGEEPLSEIRVSGLRQKIEPEEIATIAAMHFMDHPESEFFLPEDIKDPSDPRVQEIVAVLENKGPRVSVAMEKCSMLQSVLMTFEGETPRVVLRLAGPVAA